MDHIPTTNTLGEKVALCPSLLKFFKKGVERKFVGNLAKGQEQLVSM